MKNFSVRISKAILSLIALISLPLSGYAQGTISVNGTICTTPWSISASSTGTVVTVPASCLPGPTVCTSTGAPTITSFTPAAGAATTAITVTGTNLCNVTSVTINGVAATGIATGAGTSLTAIAGTGTTTGRVAVTTGSGTATSATDFTVVSLVTLTSVTPNPVVQGATLTVNGTNFVSGAVTINIGATAVVATTSTTTSASALVPASIANGQYQVTVTSNGQTTSPISLTVGTVVGCQAGDCTVEGDVIPTPSRTVPGGVTAARPNKLNGGGSTLNAYAADNVSTKCANSTPAITRLWQHNINFATYQNSGGNDYPFLSANEAMTYKFTAPAQGTSNIIQYNEGTQVFFASGYLSISDKPCDFDVSKLVPGAGRNACHSSEVNGVSIYYKATNGTVEPYECKIVPGQTYYLNVRMQDARPASRGGAPTIDSCAASGAGVCGGYVQIR